MTRIWIGAWISLLLLNGCSPWVAGFNYRPHPGLAEIPATQPSQPPVVSAFGSIIGVHKPDEQQHLPWTIEVRLRLDNNGTEPITFEQKSMELTTGDLVRFPPPLPTAPTPVKIDPGQSAVVTADLPFPEARSYDQFDLDSLQLRWLIQIGNRSVQQSLQFNRQAYENYYYDPYSYGYGPYWGGRYYGYPSPVVGGAIIIRNR